MLNRISTLKRISPRPLGMLNHYVASHNKFNVSPIHTGFKNGVGSFKYGTRGFLNQNNSIVTLDTPHGRDSKKKITEKVDCP